MEQQNLDYAEMLEIPVSTVSVVKKKSFFKHKNAPKDSGDELKERVVDSVNERVGAYVYAEDLSEPIQPVKKKSAAADGKGGTILMAELIAACVIALAIFMTNIFMPNSFINTFIGSLTENQTPVTEPTYSEMTLSPVVSELSEAEVTVAANGVLSFTAKSAVYPICGGTVKSVAASDAGYTVQIAHTSTFTSVITGLSEVYSAEGTKVQANVPFAYSNGEKEVRVSMYDGETLLNCYTLSGEVPVWNS